MDAATFILSDGSMEYTPSQNDLEWLAKSLYMESKTREGRIACAYCMIQRFMRWPGKRWNRWAEFLRAFSTPINPIWADPTTAKCMQYPENCTPSMVSRRKKIQEWTWLDIPTDVRNLTLEWASGQLNNHVPNAVNFSSEALVKRQGKTGVTIGGNTFLEPSQDSLSGWKNVQVYRQPLAKIPKEYSLNSNKKFFFLGIVGIALYAVLQTGWAKKGA